LCLNAAFHHRSLGLHPLPTFPLFYLAVLWAAWYGGLGPSLLATALGAIAVAVMIADRALGVSVPSGVAGFAAYLIVTLTSALLVEAQKRARRAVERAEAERRLTHEYAPIGICRIDLDGRFLEVNSRMSEITGYSRQALSGQRLEDLFHREERAGSRESFEQLRRGAIPFFRNEQRLVQQNGTVIWANVTVSLLPDRARVPDAAVAIVQDVTEQKQAEERLRNQQKLESVGLLAAGVAHDFNNLMTTILGFASLIRERAPAGSRDSTDVNTIITSARHGAELTRQLLAYAGKGQFVSAVLDVSEVVRQTETLLRASLGERGDLRFELAEELPCVQADPTQLQQLIANLVINSAEAIDHRESLTVIVRTGIRKFSEYAHPMPIVGELGPGEYVMLEVEDDGVGMDDLTTSQMFDPFFSTKFTGRGLGLAAVSGIVRSLGGAILVSTAPDHGTTVTVLVPPAPAASTLHQSTPVSPLSSE
jgi:PAS domain S-box-containing protein